MDQRTFVQKALIALIAQSSGPPTDDEVAEVVPALANAFDVIDRELAKLPKPNLGGHVDDKSSGKNWESGPPPR